MSDRNDSQQMIPDPSALLIADDEHLTSADEQTLVKKGVTLPMGYDQLQRYLPHRYPFMLIDRVLACRPDDWIIGLKNISNNEPYFQGHFPTEPIMPGVLIIEAMAQLSGILGFINEGVTAEEGYLFLFAGMDKARFKKQVIPGDQLVIKAKMMAHKQDIYKLTCHAYVNHAVVALADITLARQRRVPS